MFPKKYLSLVFCFAISLALVLAVTTVTVFERSIGIDFYQYWVVPKILKEYPNKHIYNLEERQQLANIYYEDFNNKQSSLQLALASYYRRDDLRLSSTPFLYAVMSLFSGVDYDFDLRFCRFVSGLLAVVAILILGYFARFSLLLSSLIAFLYLFFFAPYRSDLYVGNINQLQLFLLVLLLAALKGKQSLSWFFGGLVAAGICFLKPNLVLILPMLSIFWFFQRCFRKLLMFIFGVCFGSAIYFVIGNNFIGADSAWFEWLQIAERLHQSKGYSLLDGNFSLRALSRLVWPSVNSVIISLTVLGLSLLVVLRTSIILKSQQFIEDTIEWHLILLSLLTTFLASELVWLHYYTVLLPFLILNLRRARTRGHFLISDYLSLIGFFLLGVNYWWFAENVSALLAAQLAVFGVVLFYLATCINLTRSELS